MDYRRLTPTKFLTVLFLFHQILKIVSSEEECESEKCVESEGQITSTSYPYNYPNDYCKYWLIQGRKGKTITISFIELDIPEGFGGHCNEDVLEIGPVPNKYYCGSHKKYIQPYISTHNLVWLKFKTNEFKSAKGFNLQYIIGSVPSVKCGLDKYRCDNGKCIYHHWRCNGVDECGDNSEEQGCYVGSTKTSLNGEDERSTLSKNYNCNRYYHKAHGYIVSPNYPLNYPNHISCEWQIHSMIPNKPIQLRFISFQLQSTKNTDYLVIYDGRDKNSALLSIFNGARHPPLMLESNTEWVLIKFHADSSINTSGFNISYQTKGMCMRDQRPCGGKDENCYEANQRCDKIWDCKQHGTDEKGCHHCGATEYSCGSYSGKCYHEDVRCDGKSYCFDYSDEKNCTADKCGAHRGLFLCDNGRCIYETWKCDNSDDCDDGSDEMDCSGSTTRVIIAAVVGSLICSLLLVVALGCTCRLYLLRTRDNCQQRHSTPLSRLQIEIMGRRAPPPSYNEAMLTSRPYEEVRQEILSRQGVTLSGEINMANRQLPVPPYEPPAQETSTTDENNFGDSLLLSARSDIQLISQSNSDTETSACDNPNFESDDELLDLVDESDVHLQMSQNVSIFADWRSNSSLPISEDDASSDTQLLDVTEKNDKDCDKNTSSTQTSTNCDQNLPNQSMFITDSPNTSSPDSLTQIEESQEDSEISLFSDTVPLLTEQ